MIGGDLAAKIMDQVAQVGCICSVSQRGRGFLRAILQHGPIAL
jgi:hypothetical protein